MSASTVSITANTASRRRPVVVTEKKSTVELVGSVAGDDDKVTGAGGVVKDRSHSIRGESILGRSTDNLLQVKKSLPNSTSTVLPTRPTRKSHSKPEKPRWLKVISVLTKNLFLLLVLFGLVQMIRRLVLNYGADPNSAANPSLGISEFEGRIAEMESFVKTTTKMMQVQVEVVDRKLENEIGGLKRELNKKIEEKGAEFSNELKVFEGKTERIEKYLGELREADWISKQDFEEFYEEFKKAKGIDEGSGDVNLDDVRTLAREIVEREIEKHAADGLGRVDYALASGGAMVVKHSDAYSLKKGSLWFSSHKNGVHNAAERMLRPSFGEPGQCFPLKGDVGFVQIRLRTAIIPEAVTLEHIAKSVAYDRSSAPKDCRVYGWLQSNEAIDPEVDADKMIHLTAFTYDLEKSNAQTVNLDSAGSTVIDTIRFEFLSNHGSPSHTCIYRLRVHGHEP